VSWFINSKRSKSFTSAGIGGKWRIDDIHASGITGAGHGKRYRGGNIIIHM
jgi:hypothetical protein